MAIKLPTLNPSTGSCDCEPYCVSEKAFQKLIGFDVCPNISGGPTNYQCYPSNKIPSCVNGTITGTLYSDEFSQCCAESKTPKADVYAWFDDRGTITGNGSSLTCDLTGNCRSCGVQGTLTPFVETTSGGKIKLSIQYATFNAYWGGPYGINLTCRFYFV